MPDRPEAWLLTVARRELVQRNRHDKVREAGLATIDLLAAERAEETEAMSDSAIPDERLRLMWVCAPPPIAEAARTPLMLQTVLGLDAACIASAFLMAPAAMGQRLVRAKAKIRDAGIAFRIPERDEMPERLDAVLQAIYAAYGTGWDALGTDDARCDLAQEAIWLARVVVSLMPGDPEALGLLALMLHAEARRGARRAEGRYVPLTEQDTALWREELIHEAEGLLRRAASLNRLGRFQLEAAIQSVHAERRASGRTNWQAVAGLYGALLTLRPTTGAQVAYAAAIGESHGGAAGLACLDAIDAEQVATYQPYWAVKAHLLSLAGLEGARDALTRAIGLTEDPAVRDYLLAKGR